MKHPHLLTTSLKIPKENTHFSIRFTPRNAAPQLQEQRNRLIGAMVDHFAVQPGVPGVLSCPNRDQWGKP